MSSPRTALRERVAALGRARRAIAAGRIDDAEAMLLEELERWPGNRDAQALLAEVTRAKGGTPGLRPGGGVRKAAPRARPSSTEAWSSFEQRVRERRIAKCAEHARVAIAHGDAGSAVESIDEIETLGPGHPMVGELQAMLREHGLDVHKPRAPVEPLIADAPRDDEASGERPAAADDPALVPPDVVVELPEPAPTDVAAPALDSPGTLHRAVHPIEPYAPPTAVLTPDALHDPLELFAEPARIPIGEVAVDADSMRRVDALGDARPSDGGLGAKWESAPPLRERGTHVVGILLVLLSVIALSGWLGYQLFRPVAEVPIVPPGDKVADASAGSPPPPPVPEPEAPRTGDPTGTIGRDDGAAALPTPGTQPPEAQSSTTPTQQLPAAPAAPSVQRPTTTSSTDPSSSDSRRPDETARSVEPETPAAPSTSVGTQSQSPSEAESQAPPAGQSPVPGNTEAPPVPVPAPTEPASPAREEPAPATPPPATSEASSPDAGDATETSPQDAEALRGLIEGYVAGYNNLDAEGVRSVWPGVDQRALARAFSQLRSQRLAFSRCEVRASGDTGHGFCTGRATWRPRVGGGERTERRVWRFDFGQRAGRWSIEKVGVEH